MSKKKKPWYRNLFPSQLMQGSRAGRVRPSPTGTAYSLPPYDRIPNLVPARPTNRSRSKASAPDDFLDTFVNCVETPPAEEDCCICYERLCEVSGHASGSPEDSLVIQLEKCSHMFHKLCLHAMYNSGPKDRHLQCPSCKTIYGEKMGNCPRGDMEYKLIDAECHGYEGCRTYQILYHIQSGVQGPEHPCPGKRFSTRGFPRVGYIPDCDKGRKVLQLLIVAWRRRLTFTIGTSTTTGEDNTVTWNEIHHKTELGSNYSGHGYPDDNYLDNVLMELAIHGITEKDLPS